MTFDAWKVLRTLINIDFNETAKFVQRTQRLPSDGVNGIRQMMGLDDPVACPAKPRPR